MEHVLYLDNTLVGYCLANEIILIRKNKNNLKLVPWVPQNQDNEFGHHHDFKSVLKSIKQHDSVAHITFSCDYSKIAQGLHGKQLSFHYLLDLKRENEKTEGLRFSPVHFVVPPQRLLFAINLK